MSKYPIRITYSVNTKKFHLIQGDAYVGKRGGYTSRELADKARLRLTLLPR